VDLTTNLLQSKAILRLVLDPGPHSRNTPGIVRITSEVERMTSEDLFPDSGPKFHRESKERCLGVVLDTVYYK
jgi:hypothetical protein